MNDFQEALIGQVAETHAGDPWYGSSRAVVLADLNPEQAAAHPIPGGHSIWELVLHMTSWTNEVRRRVDGHAAATPHEGDWPAIKPGSGNWDAARMALDFAHARLLTSVKAIPPERWTDVIRRAGEPAPPPGKGITVTGMLVGLAQHDAYHIGQIAQLRRALAAQD